MREGQRPIRVKVSSPSDKTPYTLWLQVDQAAPAGLKADVRVDTKPQEFRPGETREVTGTVTTAPGGTVATTDSTKTGGGDKKCGLGGTGTVVVLLGLALLGLARRSWTNG